LRKWGRELRKSAADAPELLTETIQRIDQEVNELIN